VVVIVVVVAAAAAEEEFAGAETESGAVEDADYQMKDAFVAAQRKDAAQMGHWLHVKDWELWERWQSAGAGQVFA
jgi:hypothetical protein